MKYFYLIGGRILTIGFFTLIVSNHVKTILRGFTLIFDSFPTFIIKIRL